MRRLLIVMAAGLLLAAMMAAPAAAERSPFTGAWTSTDVDGSFQRLSIGGGPSPQVSLYDTGATVCSDDVPPSTPARVFGNGVIAGDTLTVDEFVVICLSAPPAEWDGSPVVFTITAQPDGTLVDGTGVVWTRR